MQNKIARWLAPQRWRDLLHKVVTLAGAVTGGFTTYSEANQFLHGDVVAAALLAIFFQGGMYITARLANKSARANQCTLTTMLCLTWILLAVFPAYASGLDIFDTLDSFLQDILPLLLDHASDPKKRRAGNIPGAPHEDYNF